MAVKNRDRVGRAFEVLATGLAPYVDRTMEATAGADWFAPWSVQERGRVSLNDPQFLLKVMRDAWNQAFARALGRTDRT